MKGSTGLNFSVIHSIISPTIINLPPFTSLPLLPPFISLKTLACCKGHDPLLSLSFPSISLLKFHGNGRPIRQYIRSTPVHKQSISHPSIPFLPTTTIPTPFLLRPLILSPPSSPPAWAFTTTCAAV